nr:unnamed protein product [Callosobruchus analis]
MPTDEKFDLFTVLLEEIVVPDDAFLWIAESSDCDSEVIKTILVQKRHLDDVIKNILTVLNSKQCSNISLHELHKTSNQMSSPPSVYEQHYICTLLSGKSCEDLDHVFPIANIERNYRNTLQHVDETIRNIAYMADVPLLESFINVVTDMGITFIFDPQANEQHKSVLQWLRKNIERGITDTTSLGWFAGPDGMKWPSTRLADYLAKITSSQFIVNVRLDRD